MRKPIFIRHKSFNIFMGYSDPNHCAAATEVAAEAAAKETDKAEAKPARKSSKKAESAAE